MTDFNIDDFVEELMRENNIRRPEPQKIVPGVPMTWNQASARMGRNDFPDILMRCHLSNVLSDTELRHGFSRTWIMSEYPSKILDIEMWEGILGKCAVPGHFISDKSDDFLKPLSSLPEMLTLYRGAHESAMFGWSWTDDLEKAKWFADRFQDKYPGSVYTAQVPRHMVVAVLESRGEREYVVAQIASISVKKM